MLTGFPQSYLYFLFQNELHFTINQDYFRYFILTLGTIIGVIMGPVFGFLSDRTKSRLGRRRPWILIFAPLSGLLFWCISVPLFREQIIQSGAIYIYIITIFSVYSISFNAMNIPYIGLMADITPDNQRIQMSSFYNLIGGVGTGINLLLPALLLLMVNSYIFVCGILALIYINASLITLLKIKEPEQPVVPKFDKNEKESYFIVLKDRKFLIFEIAQFFWNFVFAIIFASITALAFSVFEIKNELEFGILGVLLLGVIGAFFYIWNVKGDKWGKERSLMFALFSLAILFPLTLIFSLTPASSIVIEIPNFLKFRIDLPSSTFIPIQIQGIIWFVFLAIGLSGIAIFPYSILMGILKKGKEATYMGFNSTFVNISGTIGTFFMGLLTFYLGAKNTFYIVGPILGIFCFIAGILIKKIKEK